MKWRRNEFSHVKHEADDVLLPGLLKPYWLLKKKVVRESEEEKKLFFGMCGKSH